MASEKNVHSRNLWTDRRQLLRNRTGEGLPVRTKTGLGFREALTFALAGGFPSARNDLYIAVIDSWRRVSEYNLNRIYLEVNAMARIRGAEPRKQGLVSGLFTRIVYAMTRRRVGRVVIPVQLVAHHPKLLWGYGQMEQAFASSDLVGAGLKDLAQLRVATLIGCPF